MSAENGVRDVRCFGSSATACCIMDQPSALVDCTHSSTAVGEPHARALPFAFSRSRSRISMEKTWTRKPSPWMCSQPVNFESKFETLCGPPHLHRRDPAHVAGPPPRLQPPPTRGVLPGADLCTCATQFSRVGLSYGLATCFPFWGGVRHHATRKPGEGRQATPTVQTHTLPVLALMRLATGCHRTLAEK